ncbi:MAG: acyl-CoA dehydrogenase family protein [Bdellovibrionales bacterium]|nr:acyl-CoA dehydrogenase family protein [Bdellovibrionales bacterium]
MSPDFFSLDSLLSKEEKATQSLINKFVTKSLMPTINEHFQAGTFPKDLIPEFGKLGLLGATIKGYGCPGLSYTTYGLMMKEIERCDSGVRSFISVQGALAMYPIATFGTEEQKNKYLPKMAKGELIGCFGLTEPEGGSNPGAMTTKVIKDGSDYLLSGKKRWLTNGSIADIAIIWAKNEDGKVIGLIVDLGLKGITVKKLDAKFSLRVSYGTEMQFDNVRIKPEQVLGVIGLKGPFSCLNIARYGISWGVVGAAEACYLEALDYSLNRSPFGKPLASHQLIQAKLVTMFTEITKAQMLAYHLGRSMDQGQTIPPQISMAKMNNVSEALKIARLSRDILGANGVTYDYHTGRHLMNLETVNTYEGTEDIHRLILGQHITGISAY